MKNIAKLLAGAAGLACAAGFAYFAFAKPESPKPAPESDPSPPPGAAHGCPPASRASCALLQPPHH